MFNIRGDDLWLHNISGSPILFFPVGGLFVAGIVLAVQRAFRKDGQARGYTLVCVWFVVLLIPHLLTSDIPNAVRATGLIPAVFIFAAIGGDALYERLKRQRAFKYAFLAGLILTGATEFYRYFVVWAGNPGVASAFAQQYVSMAQYLNALPKETKRTVIGSGWGMRAVRFLTREPPTARYILPEEAQRTDFACGSVVAPLFSAPIIFA